MGLNKAAVTVVLTFLISAGALIASVACGPANGGKVHFMPPPKGKDRQVSCLSQFAGRYGVRVDSDKMTVEGKSIGTKICQAEQGVDYTPYTLPPGTSALQKVVYKPAEQRITYEVGKVDKVLRLSLAIGVDFGGQTPDRDEAKKAELLDSLCLNPLRNVWKESGGRKLELNIKIHPIGKYDSNPNDQILTLKPSPAEAGKEPRYIALLWPDRGQFIPHIDAGACTTQVCRQEARAKANLRFCANLALVIGQWLGLKAPEADSPSCQAPARPQAAGDTAGLDGSEFDEEDGLAAGAPQKAKSFMEADPNSPDFWSKARFSRADFATILEPACKGKLKPGAKADEKPADQPAGPPPSGDPADQ